MTDPNESIRELIASEVAHAEAVSGPDPSLSDFLLARIAEDEEGAPRHLFDRERGGLIGIRERILAECEAKRRIVAECGKPMMTFYGPTEKHVMRLLALPYADHPDYREEWKA